MGNYKKHRPEKAISNSEFRSAGVEWIIGDNNIIIGATHNGKNYDRKWVDDLFYKLGLDTKHSVITLTDIVLHKLNNNKIVADHRILGTERLDKEWLDTGKASPEAINASSRMLDMPQFLHKLANGGHSD